ncbi:MAG: Tm-1-like ATP-binding domain-containing protein [Armatimonadota bacterium]|nr:Tm-1-like ATP-binding domain-containing protein [Armatimonadota bacterium]MDR7448890.1 Tm-1-like ATP-binding domain-containing protein [Armatimonadota bacterium]MDR7460144.1 Tm-1-like ATP-binding domain-containing protein [Armatimonadota bacterium]MDR7479230.1 Tm-1-like ATP-binding domain-containing protein [Armatimonadota bacterium]MDR7487858.1 Tm-1-like ATP-binding domain-containing protein [Armatimonadota bacterium]
MSAPVVAVVATLDTKGEEARYLADRLRVRGLVPRLVDVGLRPTPRHDGEVDVVRAASARLPGRRDEALAVVGREAARLLAAWHAAGDLAGVVGLGGNQGTTAGAMAMRDLPLGLPKLLVSTVASGNLRPYLGSSDIAVLPAVADLLGGPNRLTRPLLERAAGMMAGMILPAPPGRPPLEEWAPAVALTALGNTQRAVERAMDWLRRRGYEPVPFHASGCGGSAMETLLERGLFAGVLDLTTHELLGEVWADDIYAPLRPRLVAAGRTGLPQVVGPGGLDYFVFGPPETVPARCRGRPTHRHNPYNTNVRTTGEELARVGGLLAERLNAARGPTAFLYPLRGWSEVGSPGGALHDPDANEHLRRAVREACGEDVRYVELDADLNDPRYADAAVGLLLDFLEGHRVGGSAAASST